MNRFIDELKERWQDRKQKKIYTWTNFIVRILILIFLILIIRFFAGEDQDKFRDFIKFSPKTEIKGN